MLRRILRRAVRYGQQVLGTEPGLLTALVPVVVDTFKDAYPELGARQSHIVDIVAEEERSFDDMLSRGIKYFEDLIRQKSKQSSSGVNPASNLLITGQEAFFLYDTLGFPLDLTALMAAEAGLKVDVDGFNAEMSVQKSRSRDARKRARLDGGALEPLVLQAEQTAWLLSNNVKATQDDAKYQCGGGGAATAAKVMAIFDGGGDGDDDDNVANEAGFVMSAKPGDRVGVILDKTSFYAESGGQIHDTGKIFIDDKLVLNVVDCQVFGGYVLHVGTLAVAGGGAASTIISSLNVGDTASSLVNYERRRDVAPNHTMTHVLNYALRSVLGGDVDQRGSSVAADKLRFDFSCKKAVSPSQLQAVEVVVSNAIKARMPVFSSVVPLAEAKRIGGVRAVFGEMYPDPVRVITVGKPVSELGGDDGNYSVEFCGGTHIANTADAEDFVIVEEAAVAKGIRRVVGVTRDAAKACRTTAVRFEEQVTALEVTTTTSTNLDDDLSAAVAALRKELEACVISVPVKVNLRARLEVLQKKCAEENKKRGSKSLDSCLSLVKDSVEGQAMAVELLRGVDLKGVQRVVDIVKKSNPACHFFGVVEGGEGSDKHVVFTVVPEKNSGAVAEFPAEAWLARVMDKFEGKGGGKGSFAQGQVAVERCPDPAKLVTAAKEEYISLFRSRADYSKK